MKSSSQVTGLPLLGIKEGLECGTVRDIVVDPETKKVKSLILQGSKNGYEFRELNVTDVIGIGKDYVITQSITNAVASGLTNAGMAILNIRCIAASGNILGTIKDFVFDEKTGDIHSVQLDNGMDLPGAYILTLSNNTLFVTTDGDEEDGAVSSLEQEQQDYLIGRIVKNDILSPNGQVVIERGTKVTPEVIRLAEEAGVMIDLTLEL